MDAHLVNSRTLVLSTAPHNFAGAGAAHARTLELLSLVGARVEFWVPQTPFRQDALEKAGVKVNLCKIASDAYPNSDSLTYGRVTEALAEAGKRLKRFADRARQLEERWLALSGEIEALDRSAA